MRSNDYLEKDLPKRKDIKCMSGYPLGVRAAMGPALGFFLSLLIFGIAPSVAADAAGSTGAAFLELGVGARAGAMGEANTAWADDVYGMYFNPAGIATNTRQEVGFTHNTLFLDLDYNYLGYVLPLRNNGVLAVSGIYVDLGDVDRREVVGGDPSASLGTATGHDLGVSVTYARTMTEFLDLGASFKIINESLADRSATAIALDIGTKWRTPVRGLTVGLSVSNFGTDLDFVSGGDELPLTLRAGAGWRAPGGRWGVVGDLVWVKNQDVEGKFGGEFWVFPERLVLRAGVNTANDPGDGITLGAGFHWNDLAVDYAYIPFGDLGGQNLISLGYEFGPERNPVPSGIALRGEGEAAAPPQARPQLPVRTERPAPAERAPAPPRRVELYGATADPFVYREGPGEYAWMGTGVQRTFIDNWERSGFSAGGSAGAEYVVRGDYRVIGDAVIYFATLSERGTITATFNAAGDVNTPFVPWNSLLADINTVLAGNGEPVTIPDVPRAPVRRRAQPRPTPAPVSERAPAPRTTEPQPPVEQPASPKETVTLAPVVEYPSMQVTPLSERVALAVQTALKDRGIPHHLDAEYRIDLTISVLEGGDLIVYGRFIDKVTGIPLGTIEVEGDVNRIPAAAERVAEKAAALRP